MAGWLLRAEPQHSLLGVSLLLRFQKSFPTQTSSTAGRPIADILRKARIWQWFTAHAAKMYITGPASLLSGLLFASWCIARWRIQLYQRRRRRSPFRKCRVWGRKTDLGQRGEKLDCFIWCLARQGQKPQGWVTGLRYWNPELCCNWYQEMHLFLSPSERDLRAKHLNRGESLQKHVIITVSKRKTRNVVGCNYFISSKAANHISSPVANYMKSCQIQKLEKTQNI